MVLPVSKDGLPHDFWNVTSPDCLSYFTVHWSAASLCLPVIQGMLRCSIAHWSTCKNASPKSYPKELEEATWLAQLTEQVSLVPSSMEVFCMCSIVIVKTLFCSLSCVFPWCILWLTACWTLLSSFLAWAVWPRGPLLGQDWTDP